MLEFNIESILMYFIRNTIKTVDWLHFQKFSFFPSSVTKNFDPLNYSFYSKKIKKKYQPFEAKGFLFSNFFFFLKINLQAQLTWISPLLVRPTYFSFRRQKYEMLKVKKQIVWNQFSQNLKPFVLKTVTDSLKLRYSF